MDITEEREIEITNLDKDTKKEELLAVFGEFGRILSCEIETDSNGQPSRTARITFDDKAAATMASASDNTLELHGKRLWVTKVEAHIPDENICFVKDVPIGLTKAEVEALFTPFGEVVCTRLKRDHNIKSRGFASVAFKDAASAKAAIEQMNGKVIEGRFRITVCAFRSWKSRQQWRSRYHNWSKELYAHPSATVYVTIFDTSMTEEKLKDLFSVAGSVELARIATTIDGRWKGYGFVRFRRVEDAKRALHMGIGGGQLAVSKVKHVNSDWETTTTTATPGIVPVGMPVLIPSYYYQLQNPMLVSATLWNNGVESTQHAPVSVSNHNASKEQPAAAVETTEIEMKDLHFLASSLSSPAATADTNKQVRYKIGEIVYPFIQSIDPVRAAKITGMIIASPEYHLKWVVQSIGNLRSAVETCKKLLEEAPKHLRAAEGG